MGHDLQQVFEASWRRLVDIARTRHRRRPVPRRLDLEIVRSAEDAAQRPDFAAVLDRGRALSRRCMATATVTTVVVIAGLVGATQLPDRQESAPVVPVVPSPTPTATATERVQRERPTPQEIVDVTAR